MAETKKAREIRARKEVLRNEIADLNAKLQEATKRVPKRVTAGPHQVAVEWNAMAEKIANTPGDTGPLRATEKTLGKLIFKKREQLRLLT